MILRLLTILALFFSVSGTPYAQEDLPFRLERIDKSPGQGGTGFFSYEPTQGGTLIFNDNFPESHLYFFDGETITELDFGAYLGLAHIKRAETGHYIMARTHRGSNADILFLPFGSITPVLIAENARQFSTPVRSQLVGDRLVITEGISVDNNYYISVSNQPGSLITLPISGIQRFYDPAFIDDRLLLGGAESLFLTDGTAEGTVDIFDGHVNERSRMVKYNGELYFASGANIFIVDATGTAVRQLTDEDYPSELLPTEIGLLVTTGNGIVYEAKTAAHGAEMFVTDGTAAGSRLLREFGPGTTDGIVFKAATYIGDQISNEAVSVFTTLGTDNFNEVWRTDGSEAGTSFISRSNQPGNGRSQAEPEERTEIGDIYFTGPANSGGEALYHYRAADSTIVTIVENGTSTSFIVIPIQGSAGEYIIYVYETEGRNSAFVFNPTTREQRPLPDIGPIISTSEGIIFKDGIYHLSAFDALRGREPAIYSEGMDSILILADVNPGTAGHGYGLLYSDGQPYYLLFTPEAGAGIYKVNENLDDVRYVSDIHGRLGSSKVRTVLSRGGEVLFNSPGVFFGWLNRDDYSNNQFRHGPFAVGDAVFGPSIGDKFITETLGLYVSDRDSSRLIDHYTQNQSTPVVWQDKFLMLNSRAISGTNARWELIAIDPETAAVEVQRAQVSTLFQATSSLRPSVPLTAVASDGQAALFTFPNDNDEFNLYRLDSTGTSSFVLPLTDGVPVRAAQNGVGHLAILQIEGEADSFLLAYDFATDQYDVYRNLTSGETVFAVQALIDDVMVMTNQRISRSVSREELVEDNDKTLFTAAPDYTLQSFTNLDDVGILFIHNGPVTSELWVTDGTSDGTLKLQDINGNLINSAGALLPEVPGWVSFTVYKAGGGRILYAYNYLQDELYEVPGPSVLGGYPTPAVGVDGQFYFAMLDNMHGRELHTLVFDFEQSESGTVFFDQNLNGIQDNEELGIANYPVSIDQRGPAYITYTDSLGQYTIANFNADTAFVSVVPEEGCYLVENTVSVLVDPAVSDRAPDFGLIGTGIEDSTTLSLISAPVRCNFSVAFWATVVNSGCTDLDLTVALQLDEEVLYNDASREPDEFSDGCLIWEGVSLAPGATWQTQLELTMPPEERAGTIVPFELSTLTLQNGIRVKVDSIAYEPSLRCAIDPNDKLVQPARAEATSSNYTQFDEKLTYIIRFQNTGNDTALNVRLEDQLGPGIIVSSFKPLAASHAHRVALSEEGLLKVYFDNIFLPDSNANQLASNGFFSFTVRVSDLAIGRAITNTAGIYFDFNAPVITNTTRSTIVEFLDQDQDGFNFYEECDDTNPALNPGAPDEAGNGIDENCDGVDGTNRTRESLEGKLSLYPNPTSGFLNIEYSRGDLLQINVFDGLGRSILTREMRNSGQISLARLPPAVYYVRVTDAATGHSQIARMILQH